MGTHRATRSVTHAHASGGGYGRVAGCPRGGRRHGEGYDPSERGAREEGVQRRGNDRDAVRSGVRTPLLREYVSS